MGRIAARAAGASGMPVVLDALTVPYRAGTGWREIVIGNDGVARASGTLREALVLARLRVDLADRAVVCIAKVGVEVAPATVFAPYSAAGTLLPLHCPAAVRGGEVSADLAVTIEVTTGSGEPAFATVPDLGAAPFDTPLAAADAAALVDVVIVEGVLARLLYLSTIEKQRVVRQGRELVASRHLQLARLAALDARGADLGVPRLIAAGGRERDDDYRARLTISSRWHLSTPHALQQILNGAGSDADANAGLPAAVGITHRFEVDDANEPLSIALRLVHVGAAGAARRARLHETLRAIYLLDLEAPPSKLLPAAREGGLLADQSTLVNALIRPDPTQARYLAPMTAAALALAVRTLESLSDPATVTLRRAQVTEADAFHELGFAVTIDRLEPARLDAAGTAAQAATSAFTGGLTPRSAAEDPLGAWLFEPCGFRTVHALDESTVLLSILPSFGQWIDGPAELSEPAIHDARYHASGTATGVHVLAAAATDALPSAATDAGLPSPPSPLDPDGLILALEAIAAAATTSPPPALADAVATGLVAADNTVLAARLLEVVNLDQIVAYPYGAGDILALGGTPDDITRALSVRVESMQAAGFWTVRGLWDEGGSRLLLLGSVSTLPGAVARTGAPPPAAYRWYSIELPAPSGQSPVVLRDKRGGRVKAEPGKGGLALLVSLAQARRGRADPYEVRVGLPTGAVLDLNQYGFVMNLLEQLHPIGIEVNTFDIRRRHVDADGDGVPEWLTSRVSRTYPEYRRRRPLAGTGSFED
jgi:hypothetical protein